MILCLNYIKIYIIIAKIRLTKVINNQKHNKTKKDQLQINMQVKRTQQFVYFQNKARHYDNIKHAKPAITSFRQQQPSPRPRPHSLMKQYSQMKDNQNLVNNILNIRNSNRSRVMAQGGYSRYNPFDVEMQRISKYGTFRQTQRYKSIQHQNSMLGQKILKIKPSIGTISDWNTNFENMKSRKKIASKHDDKKIISIYAYGDKNNKNNFIPQHYRTFLERDGSTVAIKQKLFEIPKSIAQSYIDPSLYSNRSMKKPIGFNKGDIDFRTIIKDNSGDIKTNN